MLFVVEIQAARMWVRTLDGGVNLLAPEFGI